MEILFRFPGKKVESGCFVGSGHGRFVGSGDVDFVLDSIFNWIVERPKVSMSWDFIFLIEDYVEIMLANGADVKTKFLKI